MNRQPLEIYVDDETKLTLHGLQQHYVRLEEGAKNRKLNDLLDSLEFNQVIIFVKSISRANQLDKLLQECNFPSICIHGGLPQDERIKRYQQFKNFEKRILVATDSECRTFPFQHEPFLNNLSLQSLAVVSMWSASTSRSRTTPQIRQPRTCTGSVVPVVSVPRVSRSCLSRAKMTTRSSRTFRADSKSPCQSFPTTSTLLLT